jgi:hypothetical protein
LTWPKRCKNCNTLWTRADSDGSCVGFSDVDAAALSALHTRNFM